MLPTLYKGSVKNLLGPVSVKEKGKNSLPGVIFQYSDAYSVFDWGRMPDNIPEKGKSLAIMAADFFERVESPSSWRDFSKSTAAHGIRRGITAISAYQSERKAADFSMPVSLSSTFNEIGEKLQNVGLRSHYMGAITDETIQKLNTNSAVEPMRLSDVAVPDRHMVSKRVSVVPPSVNAVLGKAVLDYQETRSAPFPRLIPLEVVFRFSLPKGSSLLAVVDKNPDYLKELPIPRERMASVPQAGDQFDFPIIELFTKLEPEDRRLTMTEALNISGLSAPQLENLLLSSVWVAGYLRYYMDTVGLELADGKLEWGIGQDGNIFLVDAIGPDELRMLYQGVQLSKEYLRTQYYGTPWYNAVQEAKKEAKSRGASEWKQLCKLKPDPISSEVSEAVSQMYQSLTNRITGKTWFEGAWDLEQVVGELKRLSGNPS